MTEVLLVSNIILWVAVVVLVLMVFALTRQVGILHERVAPAGALQPTNGPKVGELTDEMKLTTIAGVSTTVGGVDPDGLDSFILFISPTCPVCKSLVPTAKALINSEKKRMRLLFGSDGEDLQSHRNYVKDLDIESYPYFVSEALGMNYQVSKLPFAVLIGADGTLKSKGLVNTREHMESLIEAMDSGVATVQQYVAAALEEQQGATEELEGTTEHS